MPLEPKNPRPKPVTKREKAARKKGAFLMVRRARAYEKMKVLEERYGDQFREARRRALKRDQFLETTPEDLVVEIIRQLHNLGV
jgi:hypothetical protein